MLGDARWISLDQRGTLNGASPNGAPWQPPAIGFQAVLEEGHLAASGRGTTGTAQENDRKVMESLESTVFYPMKIGKSNPKI